MLSVNKNYIITTNMGVFKMKETTVKIVIAAAIANVTLLVLAVDVVRILIG